MLELSLVPKQGNVGGRFFPHTGHLGVTPVVISGKVATRLPEVCEPLGVKSITLGIRCTETAGNGLSQVLWEKKKVLLSAPDDEEYLDLGDWDSMFKTTIPTDAIDMARSTMCIPEYKVVWRMEVVIEHRPIPYVGTSIAKAFALNLHNHKTPSVRPMSPPSPYTLGSEAYTSNITVSAQPGAFGPGDTFPVYVQVKPLDPETTVKKATVMLERQMDINNKRSTSPPSQHRLSSLFKSSSKPTHQRIPEEQDVSLYRKDKLAEVSSSTVTIDKSGTSWCQMEMALPARHGKWDLGETHCTKLVSISYSLKATVTLKNNKSRSSKSFICSPIPVVIASTCIENRISANKTVDLHPAKKRHRSSRRGLYMHEGNVDVSEPLLGNTEPVYTSIKGVATDVTPILLPSNHPAQSQNIQFVFPSPPPYPSKPMAVASLLNPAASPPPVSPSSSSLPTPPPTRQGIEEGTNLLRAFQSSGRRISTTTSEEDEVQPSRSRQKTRITPDSNNIKAEFAALPSLNALEMGLPYVPEDDRPRSRPRTAPIHSAFSMTNSSIPPPLSGRLSVPDHNFQSRPMTMASMGRTTGDLHGNSFLPRSIGENSSSSVSFPFAFSGNLPDQKSA
ncbi:uncharacterized protein L201_000944 [Kwoniella dendrophila CBS 6074]|uniref:Arrestin C-terminal-like domain-containing protein n=1 Tax=Kwoniella dendrophila CBS 6074 TaxID=1295534 RepID=A0AAX4JMB2_9TREE